MMNDAGVQLRVVLAEDCAEYVRYARRETLRAIGFDLHPDLVEPLRHAAVPQMKRELHADRDLL